MPGWGMFIEDKNINKQTEETTESYQNNKNEIVYLSKTKEGEHHAESLFIYNILLRLHMKLLDDNPKEKNKQEINKKDEEKVNQHPHSISNQEKDLGEKTEIKQLHKDEKKINEKFPLITKNEKDLAGIKEKIEEVKQLHNSKEKDMSKIQDKEVNNIITFPKSVKEQNESNKKEEMKEKERKSETPKRRTRSRTTSNPKKNLKDNNANQKDSETQKNNNIKVMQNNKSDDRKMSDLTIQKKSKDIYVEKHYETQKEEETKFLNNCKKISGVFFIYTFSQPCWNCLDNYILLLNTFSKIKFHIYFSNYEKGEKKQIPRRLEFSSRFKIKQIFPHKRYQNLSTLLFHNCFSYLKKVTH